MKWRHSCSALWTVLSESSRLSTYIESSTEFAADGKSNTCLWAWLWRTNITRERRWSNIFKWQPLNLSSHHRSWWYWRSLCCSSTWKTKISPDGRNCANASISSLWSFRPGCTALFKLFSFYLEATSETTRTFLVALSSLTSGTGGRNHSSRRLDLIVGIRDFSSFFLKGLLLAFQWHQCNFQLTSVRCLFRLFPSCPLVPSNLASFIAEFYWVCDLFNWGYFFSGHYSLLSLIPEASSSQKDHRTACSRGYCTTLVWKDLGRNSFTKVGLKLTQPKLVRSATRFFGWLPQTSCNTWWKTGWSLLIITSICHFFDTLGKETELSFLQLQPWNGWSMSCYAIEDVSLQTSIKRAAKVSYWQFHSTGSCCYLCSRLSCNCLLKILRWWRTIITELIPLKLEFSLFSFSSFCFCFFVVVNPKFIL